MAACADLSHSDVVFSSFLCCSPTSSLLLEASTMYARNPKYHDPGLLLLFPLL